MTSDHMIRKLCFSNENMIVTMLFHYLLPRTPLQQHGFVAPTTTALSTSFLDNQELKKATSTTCMQWCQLGTI